MFLFKVADTIQYGVILGRGRYIIVLNDFTHTVMNDNDPLILQLQTLTGEAEIRKFSLDDILQRAVECTFQEFAVGWGESQRVQRNYERLQKSAAIIDAQIPWPKWHT